MSEDVLARLGDPGRIRTCDPLLRRQMLYPAELRDHTVSAEPRNFQPTFPIRARSPKRKLTFIELTFLGASDPRLSPNRAPCALRCVDRDTITVRKELSGNVKGLASANRGRNGC